MSSRLYIYVIYLLPFFALLHAFAIDDVSCSGNQKIVMELGVAEAFLLAEDGYQALLNGVRDQDVDRLATLLFGNNADLRPVLDSFRGIRTKSKRWTPRNEVMEDEDEVMFYCGLDRVQMSKDGAFADKWIDSVTGRPFDAKSGEKLKECKSTSDLTLGITWNPEYSSFPNPDYPAHGRPFIQDPSPSQVSLCSWFLGWAVNQHFKIFDEVVPKVLKIDAFGLLGKVLLHELTHTKVGGVSEDVDIAHGAPLGFGKAAYGWKAALILAKDGGTVDLPQEDPPDKDAPKTRPAKATENADSIALFASGVRLLNQSPPVYITDDGSLSLTRP